MSDAHDLLASYAELTQDDLHAVLGAALLDSGIGVGPTDPARLRRFARAWFAAKKDELWAQVRATSTWELWVRSAGPGQVVESDVLADAFSGQEGDARLEAAFAVLLFRDDLDSKRESYDVAVSASMRDSEYVLRVVAAARDRGLRVFHAQEMTNEWWGKNFIAEGRRVYGQLAWHFVPFLSVAYLREAGPKDAFATAMATALERADDYILPVLVGKVEVPPELLPSYIVALQAEDHSPEELADALARKVRETKARHGAARDFGAAVRGAADSAGR